MRFAEQGYEIRVGEDEVLLIDRRTWGLDYGIIAFSVLSALLLLVGGIPLVARESLTTRVPAYVLVGVAAGLLILVWRLRHVVRERRGVPVDRVRTALVIHRAANELRNRDGETLASLDVVRVSMHLDLLTRGLIRYVALEWPGSRRVVYRSLHRKRALLVLETLERAGVRRT